MRRVLAGQAVGCVAVLVRPADVQSGQAERQRRHVRQRRQRGDALLGPRPELGQGGGAAIAQADEVVIGRLQADAVVEWAWPTGSSRCSRLSE